MKENKYIYYDEKNNQKLLVVRFSETMKSIQFFKQEKTLLGLGSFGNEQLIKEMRFTKKIADKKVFGKNKYEHYVEYITKLLNKKFKDFDEYYIYITSLSKKEEGQTYLFSNKMNKGIRIEDWNFDSKYTFMDFLETDICDSFKLVNDPITPKDITKKINKSFGYDFDKILVTNQTPDEILSSLNESFYEGFDDYINKDEELKKEFNEKMQYNSEQIKKYIKRNKLNLSGKDIKNISRKFSYLNSKVFKENDNSLDLITIVEKVAKNYFGDYLYNLYKEKKYIIDITILDEFDKRKNAEDVLRTCYNREKFGKNFITLEFNKLDKILWISSIYFIVVRMHEFGHIFENLIFSNEQYYKDNEIIVLKDKLFKAKNYNNELYAVLKEGFAEDFSYFGFRFIYEIYIFEGNKEDNLENKELIFLAQRLLNHHILKLSNDKKKKEAYKKYIYWYSYGPSMMFFLRKTFGLNSFQTKIFGYLSCLGNDSISFDEFIDYIENEIKLNNLVKYDINEKIDKLLFLLNTGKEI